MGVVTAIEIACQIGPKLVRADIVGPFAIHEGLGWPVTWTLTHVATGYAVGSGFRLRESVERLAQTLAPMADWEFTEPDGTKAWSKARRDRVKGMIRGFKRDDEQRALARPTPEAKERTP